MDEILVCKVFALLPLNGLFSTVIPVVFVCATIVGVKAHNNNTANSTNNYKEHRVHQAISTQDISFFRESAIFIRILISSYAYFRVCYVGHFFCPRNVNKTKEMCRNTWNSLYCVLDHSYCISDFVMMISLHRTQFSQRVDVAGNWFSLFCSYLFCSSFVCLSYSNL